MIISSPSQGFIDDEFDKTKFVDMRYQLVTLQNNLDTVRNGYSKHFTYLLNNWSKCAKDGDTKSIIGIIFKVTVEL
jgi:DNA replicative helicase MCM subunit Mcm2 (Cdc46/Mcm family)